MKILICGLPGSGKTTLAKSFSDLIGGIHINADEVRKKYEGYNKENWDFSKQGRLKQAERMKMISDGVLLSGKMPVVDFVCPTQETRKIFESDPIKVFTIWMDTIKESKYKNTNQLFENPDPSNVDYHISEWFDNTHEVLVPVIERYMRRTQSTFINYICWKNENV